MHNLQYIVSIEQHRSLTKAAEALYVTQPTISKALKLTEDRLGVQLFERIGNRYYLTFAGEKYIEYAKRIIKLKMDMDREISEISTYKKGRLSIGYQFNRSSYMTALTFPKFKLLFPDVDIILIEDSSKGLEKNLSMVMLT